MKAEYKNNQQNYLSDTFKKTPTICFPKAASNSGKRLHREPFYWLL